MFGNKQFGFHYYQKLTKLKILGYQIKTKRGGKTQICLCLRGLKPMSIFCNNRNVETIALKLSLVSLYSSKHKIVLNFLVSIWYCMVTCDRRNAGQIYIHTLQTFHQNQYLLYLAFSVPSIQILFYSK